ncbi:MAG: AbrB/MazE/SpoVT family DNA-binding domain-containing protein [Betaproteobacteria bacterium]|nr:MAG: AbrB/MazE/SpoVT family DNA-binding domain-containing protein [Betaproteobacteria bacterium]
MEATLAERGQVVIPKAIRDQLGLTPGVLLTFSVEGGKLVIRKKVDDAFSRARGILKPEPGETVESIMRELRGRAPNDPIEPWEELRDDMYIAPEIRADHARRKAEWNAKQATLSKNSLKPSSHSVAARDKPAQRRSSAATRSGTPSSAPLKVQKRK